MAPKSLRAQAHEEESSAARETLQGQALTTANQQMEQSSAPIREHANVGMPDDYRIGAQDLLEVSVFEAPELNRSLRVSAGGEISMPLVGPVQAAGMTARELEKILDARFSKFIKDPQVGVYVRAIQSHPISVLGAVKNPGTFQLQAPMTLLQVLSKAGGLADDAGDEVLIMRGAASLWDTGPSDNSIQQDSLASPVPSVVGRSDASGPKGTFKVNLHNLLESGNPVYNVTVYSGDIVTVNHGGIVYVVGGVNRPGGFVMKNNERMTVLKAIALAEGLKGTSAKGRTRIIRADQSSGRRVEIPINLGRILSGKAADAPLEASDILFVPDSTGKRALLKGAEAAVQTASGVLIFHQY